MKLKSLSMLILLLIAVLALAACRQAAAADNAEADQAQPVEIAAAPQEPRTLTALVGAGQDTNIVNAFLPANLQIRAGDTITWKLESDEIHTVTFLAGETAPELEIPVPDGALTDLMLNPKAAFPTRFPDTPVEQYDGTSYVNSGVMSKAPAGPDAPPNDTFSLTFDEPGLYPFVCLVHPYMRGVVAVAEATEADVPVQADIDAQIKTEMEGFLVQVDAAKAAGATPRGETLADGSNLWYVSAGSSVGDPSAASFEFMTKELTVNTGDTVVWTSHEFHNITFIPAPPAPELVVPVPQQDGPPMLLMNDQITTPAKPDQIYNPAEYYSSGILGPGLPSGSNWSLTFNEPGTYKYFCGVHRQQGMEGTIIVKAS